MNRRGELGREPHQVRLAADVLQTTRAVLSDDHAQRPLTCVQSTNRGDHPLVQAVHEHLVYGGLTITEDAHSCPWVLWPPNNSANF
jgi:hypothetical protein